jgi:hypothetical protein
MHEDRKNTLKKILTFFDKFEDRVREKLSRRPILYTFIGGVSVVLFWRGVWHTADIFEKKGGILGIIFSGPGSIIVSALMLLATGLFVSFFVGDVILMSGLKREKKLIEKAESEIKGEKEILTEIQSELKDLKEAVRHESREHRNG